jgi:hypothetical protein
MHAPSHRKYPEDGLNVDRMNVGPGGKQAVLRDTTWNGETQKMTLADGRAKGMKVVLEERGINTMGMNAAKMREALSQHEDFKNQCTLVEEKVRSRGT